MQRKIMNDKLLYRIPEVAEHLSISRSKVCELLKSGELRSVHIERSRLVRARDLQRTLTPWPPLRDCQHHCETSGRTRFSASRSRSTTATP
jgi:excisionase family DNA binding protein